MKSPRLTAIAAVALGLVQAAHAADEIHWTITGQTSVTFDWRGSETTLSYGTSPGVYTNTVTAIAPTPLPTSSAGPFREAALTGLQENTLYYYVIGGGTPHTFRTPPPRGSSGFTIYVQGDVGSAKAYSRVTAVQKIVANVYGNGLPVFVLVPGDLTYGDSNGADDTDAHFNDVMVWSRDAAYMPSWGNHEWHTSADDDQLNDYEGRFGLPNSQTSPGASAAIGNGPADDWYWFDYGNVRFIAFPEPYSGAWSDWQTKAKSVMDAAQADSKITFIVTFGHRPSYSSGPNTGSSTLKSILDGLGDGHSKYKLDLSGHSHHYERTLPQHGVVHLVVGTGHASPGSIGGTKPSWSAFRTIQSGAVKLRFWGAGIEGQFICAPAGSTCYAEGGVLDSFTIGTAGDFTPPVVTMTSPAAGATVTGSVSVSATATDNSGQVASVQFKLDGQNLGAADTTAPYSISWNSAQTANGTHTLEAVASDADGNTATASIQVTVSNAADTVAPVVAMTAPASGATVSGTISVSASATDDSGQVASVQFKLDGQNLGAADTTAPYSISWNTTQDPNGSHTLSAQASDPAGNSATASIAVTVANDGVPPTVAITAPTAGATVSGTVEVTATASDDSAQVASVQFKLDGQNLGAADTTAPYSISWNTTQTTDGSHTLAAKALDPSGNSATNSIAVTVSNDSVPPTVEITSPAAGATLVGTVTLSASASDNVKVKGVQFKLDGQDLGSEDTSAPYSIVWDTTATPSGPHTLSAKARDAAGNSTTASNPVTLDNPILLFNPVADASVKQESPDKNYGAATILEADNSPGEQFLMRFVVSGLAGHPVVSAKLRLYNVNGSDSGGSFYRVGDNGWGELGVTWNTAPVADAVPFASLGAVSYGKWYDVDVTSIVTGEGTFSLCVKSDSIDGADYDSREVPAFAPQLIVTYQP